MNYDEPRMTYLDDQSESFKISIIKTLRSLLHLHRDHYTEVCIEVKKSLNTKLDDCLVTNVP